MLRGPTYEVALAALAAILALAAVLLAQHAAARRFPHVMVIWLLCLIGVGAFAMSLVVTIFGLAVTPTLRFYHGILAGISLGSLAGAIILYMVEAGATGRKHR